MEASQVMKPTSNGINSQQSVIVCKSFLSHFALLNFTSGDAAAALGSISRLASSSNRLTHLPLL